MQAPALSGCRITPLQAGTAAWFTPGTIHRLAGEGDLRLRVLTQWVEHAAGTTITMTPELELEAYFPASLTIRRKRAPAGRCRGTP
jgi:hypothetical protein